MTCAAIQTGPRTLNCEGPPAGANDHSPAYGQSAASQVPHVTSPHTSQSPAGGTGLIYDGIIVYGSSATDVNEHVKDAIALLTEHGTEVTFSQ